MGNSKYTMEHRSSWPNQGGGVINDIYLCILNLDEDYTENLTISVQFNDGVDLEASNNNLNIWQAETITQEGNTITMVLKSYASWLPLGNKLDLYFQLPYVSADIKPEIKTVTIGGHRAKYVQEF